jgi:hypothetical protein
MILGAEKSGKTSIIRALDKKHKKKKAKPGSHGVSIHTWSIDLDSDDSASSSSSSTPPSPSGTRSLVTAAVPPIDLSSANPSSTFKQRPHVDLSTWEFSGKGNR